MPTQQLDPEAVLRERIQAAIEDQGLTRKAVYNAIGISRNTFEDKMASGRFYVRELMRAATALNTTFHELCKDL
ncbi:helix-turn-helix domain-containing protein [Sinomonas soli]